VLSYVREAGEGSAYVALNFASRAATVRVPLARAGGAWRTALSTTGREAGETLAESSVLAPLEALVATS
jgi:hypothetical protein